MAKRNAKCREDPIAKADEHCDTEAEGHATAHLFPEGERYGDQNHQRGEQRKGQFDL